ncbi:hypothetical protein LQV05_000735 [Cryptococcus neoformans]|nr:hypothetical protein J007_00780 [Cryptococcus neoformans var. grubii]OXC64930.1 hypothetical protein C358_00780 [Cryptococcus neoformans var. grubii MW-RSA852]UOH79725.1 hypothetical protein LQV05_000735 [Cryptococcus neoformans]
MPRSSSPSLSSSRRLGYPSSIPSSPFPTPPFERIVTHDRLLSSQTYVRISPYPSLSPSPPPRTGPIRPGPPKHSHSFYATDPTSTYALASASSATHLSSDKRFIVAPPLERTLSSLGPVGDRTPPRQQNARPPGIYARESENIDTPKKNRGHLSSEASVLREVKYNPQNVPSSPSPPIFASSPPVIPAILVHSTTTPPRPTLSIIQTNNPSNPSSRSSSYTLNTPITPGGMLFGAIEEAEEDLDDIDGELDTDGDVDMTPSKSKSDRKFIETEGSMKGVAIEIKRLSLGH